MANETSKKKIFTREISSRLLESLKTTELYTQRLLSDIQSGVVFPAFRNGAIDFYYKGGKLFEFKEKFSTHVKYASVLHGYDKNYIRDEDLQSDVRLIRNFNEGYERIKENCALYTGVEAAGVSEIYRRSGYLNTKENIVALDIEVSFQSLETGWGNEVIGTDAKRTQDRIDLLLYDRTKKPYAFLKPSTTAIKSCGQCLPQNRRSWSNYDGTIFNSQLVMMKYCKHIRIMSLLLGIFSRSPKRTFLIRSP